MRTLTPILCALALTACGETGKPEAPLPTVDELAADLARLEELRPQCKLDRAKLGDALCNRVAEATRRRFIGDGRVPYTPSKEEPKF
ncbi:EexN family lipoprotein [Stutzerimonas kunmingensis]|uniref:EexN family lipoprotein n=1 Tax=Stutzerimonas kunmingensis TaxID=1211807 RepID=UPI0028A6DA1F|nr:EexN family lipoprotein [Stutzerimonas kunmingensis]